MTVFKKISEATGVSIDRLEEFGKNALPVFDNDEEDRARAEAEDWTKVREWCNSQYPGVEAWAVVFGAYREWEKHQFLTEPICRNCKYHSVGDWCKYSETRTRGNDSCAKFALSD